MAVGYSVEAIGVEDASLIPPAKANGILVGAKLRRYRATFDCAAATTKLTTSDTNVLFRLPRGFNFAFGIINATVTMGGTATIALGIAGTTGKYRAAAIFTAAVPTLFGPAPAVADGVLTADEVVIMTIAAASLPSVGILQIDFYGSAR